MEIEKLKKMEQDYYNIYSTLSDSLAQKIFSQLDIVDVYAFDWTYTMEFSIKKISAVITDVRDDDTERASKLLRENEIKHITRDYDVVDPISFQDMARKIKNSNWAGAYFTSLEAYNVFFESFKGEMDDSYKNSIKDIK